MEIKVSEVKPLDQKSVQEVEKTLLDKHDQELNEQSQEVESEKVESTNKEPLVVEETEVDRPTIKDEDVLSYIKNRYNKEISSVDELFNEKENNESLPEDVSKYLEFKKTTGRGFDDFVKANKNFDKLNDDQLLAEYYSLTEEDLDSEDIYYLMDSKFGIDEDIDDEKDVKKKSIAKNENFLRQKNILMILKINTAFLLSQAGILYLIKIKKKLMLIKSTFKNLKLFKKLIEKRMSILNRRQMKFLTLSSKVLSSM